MTEAKKIKEENNAGNSGQVTLLQVNRLNAD